ncbi:hypothetical protein [Actinocorallia sp. A-T 12471]|uniref:hypothetical protein n=1 Tax=Actinocorallia sp. A-T 12471 TaxID=3089813 RepID=UPI0029D3A335|nr:hypothetical protein [Actinocorallia sp. A-T 12471]MDX6743323.1 hypothetical protein [Actinocorallia sp. A-T 12471]
MNTARITRPAAASTVVGGLAFIVLGLMQAVRPQDTNPLVTGEEHIILALFALGLILVIPLIWTLAAHSTRTATIGASLITTGNALLAFGATSSNLNGEDFPWFPAVALPANLTLLAGSLTLAAALWRTKSLPRPHTAALPLTWLFTIPLSQLGGPLLTGLYYLLLLPHLTHPTSQPRA